MYRILISIFFCLSSAGLQAKKYTVTGFVLDTLGGEPLIGAQVSESLNKAVTNSMGFFSLTLESGAYELIVSMEGYQVLREKIDLTHNIELKIFLHQEVMRMEKIVITKNVYKKESECVQMGKMEIPIKQIQAIPSILGESDPLKIAQMLPGVQSAGEATAGLFVRGSAADQNLVLIDDAPVYNPFHLFGVFSIINSDALKSFDITKGGFSSEYGGRLSSVVNVNLKEGNKNKFGGNMSVGLATSKVMLEGPLLKDKISIMLSGRTTYAHLLAKPFMPADQFGSYYFYDLNMKVSAQLSSKTKLYLGATYSGDKFNVTDESTYYSLYYANVKWSNLVSSIRLNHVISSRFFWNASLLYSKYDLNTDVKQKTLSATYYLKYNTNIEDIGLKNDFTYYFNPDNTMKFGLIATQKNFLPDVVVSTDEEISLQRKIQKYSALESAIYFEDEFKIGKKINVRAGGRLNIYTYKELQYLHPEPRFSFSYNFIKSWAFKSSYTQMHQYMHLLTTKGVGLPTDLWVPATLKVPYKMADQYTAGVVKDFPKQSFSISLEGYYKKTINEISFREGVSFMQTKNINSVNGSELSWENNITTGTSSAYGAELLLHKKACRLQGWISYTLSWSLSQFKELNNGEWFYNRYDRRNNFTTTLIYQLTKKISLSASWVYLTGNPITVANSAFNINALNSNFGPSIPYPLIAFEYSGVNNFRMPAYHRLDVGINYKTKTNKLLKELEFSIYNVYNRANPYFYYIASAGTPAMGINNVTKQVSVLPIIPSINYKITF